MSELINYPKTKRGELTLNKLLNAAEMLFLEKGYFSASIVDITKHAGVGLGTFYVYFEDKYSIYKYLVLSYSRKIRRHIALSINNLETRKEMEEAGLLAYLEFIREYPQTYNILWESLHVDKQLFREYYETFADFYKRALDKSSDAGDLKEYDNEVVAYALMGIANFVGLRWVVLETTDDLETVAKEVIRMLDQGLFKK